MRSDQGVVRDYQLQEIHGEPTLQIADVEPCGRLACKQSENAMGMKVQGAWLRW